MSSKPHREEKKGSKTVRITSRCLALILKEVSDSSLNETSSSTSSQTSPSSTRETASVSDLGSEKTRRKESGLEIFEDFQHRNSSCYWNPHLRELVEGLRYLGQLQPQVLLVSGSDVDLEGLSVAWSRRLLKPPFGFALVGLGEVPGIEMQTIPQTQFTPLPEALCTAVSDLNACKELADINSILRKLQDTYSGVELPSNGVIYDTLGVLIKEKKLFHTGSGYFVVTPDTYDVPLNITIQEPSSHLGAGVTEHELAKLSPLLSSMSPMQTMILPIVTTPSKIQVKTKSCQTNFDKEARRQRKLERSQSMREKQNRLNSVADKENLSRTLSLRYKGDKAQTLFKEMNEKNVNLLNIEKDGEKQAEKTSFLTKLWNKCKQRKPESPREVEHATFSAQFPPPEWNWYQQHKTGHQKKEHHSKENETQRHHNLDYYQLGLHNVNFSKTKHLQRENYLVEHHDGKNKASEFNEYNIPTHVDIKDHVRQTCKKDQGASHIPKAKTWHHLQSVMKELEQGDQKRHSPVSRCQYDRSLSLDHRYQENYVPNSSNIRNHEMRNQTALENSLKLAPKSKHSRKHKRCRKTSHILNKSRESLIRKRQVKPKHKTQKENLRDVSQHRSEERNRYSSSDDEYQAPSSAHKIKNPHLMYQQSCSLDTTQKRNETESESDIEECSTVKECVTRRLQGSSQEQRGRNPRQQVQNLRSPSLHGNSHGHNASLDTSENLGKEVTWSSNDEINQVTQHHEETVPRHHTYGMKNNHLGHYPSKNVSHIASKDSGVNCIGLQVTSSMAVHPQPMRSFSNSHCHPNSKPAKSKECDLNQGTKYLLAARESMIEGSVIPEKLMNGNLKSKYHGTGMTLKNDHNTVCLNRSPNSTLGDSGFNSPKLHHSSQADRENYTSTHLHNSSYKTSVANINPAENSSRHHGSHARHIDNKSKRHDNKRHPHDNGNQLNGNQVGLNDSRLTHQRIVEGSETNCNKRVQFQNRFAVVGTL